MLFGDWRAARSVRIFFRSPLIGGTETEKLSLLKLYGHKEEILYLVYLVQVTLVSTEGMDAPAVQQWKFSLWGFVPGNARVYYIYFFFK